MEDPNIKTEVVHSRSVASWKVVGLILGKKHEIARTSYVTDDRYPEVSENLKQEAFQHAEFISYCFNNSSDILKKYFKINC